jgi:putative ABC transport system substrate-binding protein
MPVIGFLNPASADARRDLIAAFHQGLAEAGYVEGRNVAIEYRWALGQNDRLPTMASDLVQRRVAVIVAIDGTAAALAAKAATATMPIVFLVGADPVELGLVSSFGRPGGNMTGVGALAVGTVGKRLQVLKELLPAAAHRSSALLLGTDPLFVGARDQLVALANRHSVPAIYPFREDVAAGGLASYGASNLDAFRIVGGYAGRILSGSKPADLPVQQVTRLEMVINLKTAKALGVTIPQTLIARADDVIE